MCDKKLIIAILDDSPWPKKNLSDATVAGVLRVSPFTDLFRAKSVDLLLVDMFLDDGRLQNIT